MKKEAQSKKEIYIILFSFLVIVLLTISSNFFGFHQIETMHKITSNIYEHPLKVSNSSLTVKLDVYKIHRDMKDIVLSTSKKEYLKIIKEVNEHEDRVYKNLKIIEKKILGKEGLELLKETSKLFHDWKPIRDEVIALVKDNKVSEAILITKGEGAKHVLKLEKSSYKLYQYAKRKADSFKNEADVTFNKLKFLNYEISLFILFLFLIIVYYTVGRISKYIYKNEHITGVLAVIRDVNQLIVREKKVKKMLQESCTILTSKHVYGHAWIITIDDNNQIENIISSNSSENFEAFKEKVKNGWSPNCINNLDEQFCYIENTDKNCTECPLKDMYRGKGAFNIELKHEDKLYGYLNISVDKKYILDNDELDLLEEVAGDIAYALYNIKIENSIIELKELNNNTINSVENLIFVKNTNFEYITCNSSFEELLGKAKDQIIGKNDYDLFSKEIADSFRNYDEQMLAHKDTTSNYEWVTYPNGKEVYLLTTKSPLIDSTGNIIGLVGNSVDITENQKNLREIQQKKIELETIIQESPNPMILHKEGGKILMLNKSWINSSGFSLNETPTIDAWVEHIYDDIEIRNSIKKHIHSLYEISEKVDEGEFSFLNKNKDLLTWQFSSAPLGLIDGKRTIITSAMDVTELKHKDEMLINQSRHAAMGEMIGMIAHQWRQPLASIAMNANNMLLDIAMEKLSSTASEKYANNISKKTQHLSQTIDDFRNFFKPDKVISKVNIKDILDQTLFIVQDSLKNHNIELKSTFEAKVEVNAYPRELMQVFVNIITNSKDALTHNKSDKPVISIKVYEDEKYLNTEICDNAGGIASDILPKVFDPYFSTKEEKTGTGLGLYMCKMIIEEHLNGIIEVYNNDNGACFIVRLLKEELEIVKL